MILERDLGLLDQYYTDWRLKPNPTKMEVAVFHLNNREVNRRLHVCFKGERLNHNPTPKYLSLTLVFSLTYRHHIDKLRLKLNSRNNILQMLVGSGWGAVTDTLRISSISLVYSTAEYCSAVWRHSSHAKKINITLNQTMRCPT